MNRPEDKIVLNTRQEKESRIIDITTYLTHKVSAGREKGYQPHNQDEDQNLREEAFNLRLDLGIINADGKINKLPDSQTPPEGIAKNIGTQKEEDE